MSTSCRIESACGYHSVDVIKCKILSPAIKGRFLGNPCFMSITAQQTETEALIEQIRVGGEATFAAIRALIRVAMRVRQHWLPRGTIDVTASLCDLSPALTARVQSHVENVMLDRLKNSPQEQEQILLVNALSQWGGEHSANYLSEQVLAGKFTEEVVNQSLVAFGILGGQNSVTALVSTMMHGNERLATNADRNLSELADGGSEDMLQSSSPFSIGTVEKILLSVNFAAIPINSDPEFSRALSRFARFLERRCEQPVAFWPVFNSAIRRDKRAAVAAEAILTGGDGASGDEEQGEENSDPLEAAGALFRIKSPRSFAACEKALKDCCEKIQVSCGTFDERLKKGKELFSSIAEQDVSIEQLILAKLWNDYDWLPAPHPIVFAIAVVRDLGFVGQLVQGLGATGSPLSTYARLMYRILSEDSDLCVELQEFIRKQPNQLLLSPLKQGATNYLGERRLRPLESLNTQIPFDFADARSIKDYADQCMVINPDEYRRLQEVQDLSFGRAVDSEMLLRLESCIDGLPPIWQGWCTIYYFKTKARMDNKTLPNSRLNLQL